MHAHIQSIMAAVLAIGEIERAFWGGRHPAWSAEEKYGRSRDLTYRHRLVQPIPAPLPGAFIVFQWTIEVDWMRDPAARHGFIVRLFVDGPENDRKEVMAEELHLDAEYTILRRDQELAPAQAVGPPWLETWRRRYREAVTSLGIEWPVTFERPERASETFRAPKPPLECVPAFAAELGSLILDELGGVPLPGGA
ncbi:hypothetical protein EDM68_00345 [Candidatus Uhrbacteria bacterium]|nr:MAG: hypothetical protein EDM68_00345 [Candidatus Uhrbacteria bacterium]